MRLLKTLLRGRVYGLTTVFCLACATLLTSAAARADDVSRWLETTIGKSEQRSDDDYSERRRKSRDSEPTRRRSSLGQGYSRLGGPIGENHRKKTAAAPPKAVKLASLGPPSWPKVLPADPAKAAAPGDAAAAAPPSIAPGASGNIKWVANSSCLNTRLQGVLATVAATFGPVQVNSTCRSRRHNAAVGGATRSQHLTGDAADFRVKGKYGNVTAFLRKNATVGGLKHYGGGLFHIDTGPRRTW
jgi:hypothetical protein